MKSKIILNYIMGFIISLLISLTGLLLIFKLTVFNKEYIINLLDKENYYGKIYDEILEEMDNDIMPSGFSIDIIKDTFTKDEVKKDIITFLDNVYQGKITTLDKTSLKIKIDENIRTYLTKSNLKITDQEGVNNFINDLVNDYQNEICLYSYANGFINTFYHVYKIINILVIVSIILLFIIIIISKLFLKFNYLSSSILASGLIILFLRLFIYEGIDTNYLLVITEKFSDMLSVLLNIIGNYLYYIGLGLIVLGIVLSCKVFIKKCQGKEKIDKILKKR